MKFSYNWLQSFFGKKLPKPADLAEVLVARVFEVEGIEQNGGDYLLDIAVTPNRAHDCLSHLGIAREIAVALKMKLKEPKISPLAKLVGGKKAAVDIAVADKNLCPRYIGVVVRGVRVGPSPKWLRLRIESLGQKSINNIVDATNFVMNELGQPLHAFDLDKISGPKIVIRPARDQEKIVTLDDVKCVLDKSVLIIADTDGALAVAGIKGGKKAEINEETRDILLEAANFNAANIRKSSRKLGIVTDSSVRFAAELDAGLAEEAMSRLIEVVKQVAGGRVSGGAADIYSPRRKPAKILFLHDKMISALGTQVRLSAAADILAQIGCRIKSSSGGRLLVELPARRLDLATAEDLVEEVGRFYGYEKISPKPLVLELAIPRRDDLMRYRAQAQDALKGWGFFEAYNYSFLGEKELAAFGAEDFKKLFKLRNPTRPEFGWLRPTLIPGLVGNIKENLKHAKDLKFFETGKVYFGEETENLGLAMSLAGGRVSGAVLKSAELKKELFYQMKGVLAGFFESFGATDVWFDDAPSAASKRNAVWSFLHPFQSAEIKSGDAKLGVMGSLHPEFLAQYKIKEAVAVAEMNFENVLKLIRKENEYLPVSRYPALMRDLAVLVASNTRSDAVCDVIENTGGHLLIDADLFDVYEGEELPEGKKNFAFHLIFQSKERTLTDEEVDDIMASIIDALEENPDREVRK